MLNLCFYFQVHQPYRLDHFSVFDIGRNRPYFDDKLNRLVMEKVAEKCYLPANKLFLDLIDRYEGAFKISYSITGTAIEQFKAYCPEVLDSFKALAASGCVEFIAETYFHSLSSLFDTEEFLAQVARHRQAIQDEFGFTPITFRNTELIYWDGVADLISQDPGLKVILAEGADRILDWRSPLYAYQDYSHSLYLLLKSYSLSDDIAFRFSNRDWPEWPLTVDKFVDWVARLKLGEPGERNMFLNLFMDYETFGEHQWAETGIFEFIRALPGEVFKHPHIGFAWPSDVVDLANYQPEALSFASPVSWADTERDLSAWMENSIQKNALEAFYGLLSRIKASGRSDLMESARRLSTSDHFYYMSTKYFQDGDVHKYFSPYGSPEDSYLYFLNVLADLEERL